MTFLSKIMNKLLNPNSKEIREELSILSKKYNIKRGIILFEEEDKPNDPLRYRTIVFSEVDKDFKPSTFARMFLECLNISNSFKKIIDSVSSISLMDMLKDIHTTHELEHGKRKPSD